MLDAPAASGHFVGDYVGLVTSANGPVHPSWGTATRDDVTNLHTRTLDYGGHRVAGAP